MEIYKHIEKSLSMRSCSRGKIEASFYIIMCMITIKKFNVSNYTFLFQVLKDLFFRP